MMHAGEIYVGRIGHPDYAQMDILGPTVNIAASLGPYNRTAASKVVATSAVVAGAGDEFGFGPGQEASFTFTDVRVTVHELLILAP